MEYVILAFIHAISICTCSSPLLLGGAPDTARILCWSLMPKCQRATSSDRFAQDPYVAARAGIKPAALRTRGTDYQLAATLHKLAIILLAMILLLLKFLFQIGRGCSCHSTRDQLLQSSGTPGSHLQTIHGSRSCPAPPRRLRCRRSSIQRITTVGNFSTTICFPTVPVPSLDKGEGDANGFC